MSEHRPEIPESQDVGAPEGEYPREPRAAFARDITPADWRALLPVLATMVLGLLLVFVNFRLGAVVLSLAVLAALLQRILRSDESVGILAVRRRALDIAVLGVLFVGLAVLSIVVP